MRKTTILLSCLSLLLFVSSCNNPDTATTKIDSAKTDMSKVKADIQALGNQWADAMNKKDINALMAFYSDDAQSMQDGAATLNGKAAIQAQQEKDFAAPPKYASLSFETQDVYGTADEVTEVGKTNYMDAAGKVISTGKYISVYQKKDGKYKCVREIFNRDSE